MPTNNGTQGFFSPLHLERSGRIYINGRPQWMLVAPLVFVSRHIGRLNIPVGFKTDLASVPRLPLVFWLAGDTAHGSAVVHDYLCRVMYPACQIDWKLAAKVFLEAMEHEGVPWWRRRMMYLGVRLAAPRRACPPLNG